jgi:hypothetical protein
MSAPLNDGGPAFPVPSVSWKEEDGKECVAIGTHGMTLRDYFAGQALAGFCAAQHDLRNHTDKVMAIGAYRAADAMLAARKAKL